MAHSLLMTANEKRSLALKGRKKSLEHVVKVRADLIGRKASAEARLNMSVAHLGQQPTPETRLKLSLAQKAAYAEGRRVCTFNADTQSKTAEKANLRLGALHPNWIEDRTKLAAKSATRTMADFNWSQAVKRRDARTCVLFYLGGCGGRLEAHHIRPWKSHPELRYDVDNGVTLCQNHHPLKKSEVHILEAVFRQIVLNKKG